MEMQHKEIMGLAEAKQQASEKVQKNAIKKSQQALQQNAQCMDEEIPQCNREKCKKGREACCLVCQCDHKRFCQLGLQQVALKESTKKSKRKVDRFSQQAVLEALEIVDNVVGRPSTKRKTSNRNNSNATTWRVHRNAGIGSSI